VFLRNTGISGELSCDLMIDTLTHLSLATNNIDGTVPNCITQAPNIEELFLSRWAAAPADRRAGGRAAAGVPSRAPAQATSRAGRCKAASCHLT
jgi:hypothetical protein